jgi:hypothetical protein
MFHNKWSLFETIPDRGAWNLEWANQRPHTVKKKYGRPGRSFEVNKTGRRLVCMDPRLEYVPASMKVPKPVVTSQSTGAFSWNRVANFACIIVALELPVYNQILYVDHENEVFLNVMDGRFDFSAVLSARSADGRQGLTSKNYEDGFGKSLISSYRKGSPVPKHSESASHSFLIYTVQMPRIRLTRKEVIINI